MNLTSLTWQKFRLLSVNIIHLHVLIIPVLNFNILSFSVQLHLKVREMHTARNDFPSNRLKLTLPLEEDQR